MNPKLKPGDQAPDFNLPAVDGAGIRLAEQLPHDLATVVMFLCNHCPYVVAYIPRIIRLQEEFSDPRYHPRGANTVRFLGICSNDDTVYPQDSFENMKIAARQWRLNFPYLRDQDQSVARAYGAERTPEVFVLDQQGTCRYEGGIDDNCKEPDKVTRRPLRDALLALTAGEPVSVPQSYAVGCTMKWKNRDALG
jgi:peroxiredoxin